MFEMLRKLLPPGEYSSEKTPEFVLICYPGIVKNVEKALDTLGGRQVISEVACMGIHVFT